MADSPLRLYANTQQRPFTDEEYSASVTNPLQRGFYSSAHSLYAGDLANEALNAEAQGRIDEASALRAQAHEYASRAQTIAPQVQSFDQVNDAGSGAEYLSGLLGSSVLPMAGALATAVTTRVLGPRAIPGISSAVGGFGAGYKMTKDASALRQMEDPVAMAQPVEARQRAATQEGILGGAAMSIVPAGIAGGTFRRLMPNTIGREVLAGGISGEGQYLAAKQAKDTLNPNRDTTHDSAEEKDLVISNALLGGIFGAPGHAADFLGQNVDHIKELSSKGRESLSNLAQRLRTKGDEAFATDDVYETADNINRGDTLKQEWAQRVMDALPESLRKNLDPNTELGRNVIAGLYTAHDAGSMLKSKVEDLKSATKDLFEENTAKDETTVHKQSLVKTQLMGDLQQIVYDHMTPEAKAAVGSATDSNYLHELANSLGSLYVRLAPDHLNPKDPKRLSKPLYDIPTEKFESLNKLKRVFDIFEDPEGLAKSIESKIQEHLTDKEKRDTLSKTVKALRAMSSAEEDVKQPNSFLYNMLPEAARDRVNTSLFKQMARDVDALVATPTNTENYKLRFKALTNIVGSKQKAQRIVDYYATRNGIRQPKETSLKETAQYQRDFEDTEYAAQHPDEVEKNLVMENQLTEHDELPAEYHYKEKTALRPYHTSESKDIYAHMRDIRTNYGPGTKIERVKLTDARPDVTPDVLDSEVRRDIEKRIKDHKDKRDRKYEEFRKADAEAKALREQYAEQAKKIPEKTGDLTYSGKAVDVLRPDLRQIAMKGADAVARAGRLEKEVQYRNTQIQKLEGQREAPLDQFEVLKTSKRVEADHATDKELESYKRLLKKETANKADPIRATRIRFKQKDGKPLVLSAESMWLNYRDQRGSKQEKLRQAVSDVLARPDIEGLEPDQRPVIDRATGETLDLRSMETRAKALREDENYKPFSKKEEARRERIRDAEARLDEMGETERLDKYEEILNAKRDVDEDLTFSELTPVEKKDVVLSKIEDELGELQLKRSVAKTRGDSLPTIDQVRMRRLSELLERGYEARRESDAEHLGKFEVEAMAEGQGEGVRRTGYSSSKPKTVPLGTKKTEAGKVVKEGKFAGFREGTDKPEKLGVRTGMHGERTSSGEDKTHENALPNKGARERERMTLSEARKKRLEWEAAHGPYAKGLAMFQERTKAGPDIANRPRMGSDQEMHDARKQAGVERRREADEAAEQVTKDFEAFEARGGVKDKKEVESASTETYSAAPKTQSKTPEFDKLPAKNPTQSTKTYAGVGSRETPPDVLEKMARIATWMRENGYTLRSGGAKGADSAFERGALDKKEIFYAKDATDRTRAIAKEIHPAPNALGQFPLDLMARNTNQVFGKNLDSPVDFLIAWTKDGAETSKERSISTGGTGQAIDMANRKGIPVINLAKPGWEGRLREALGLKQAEPPKTEVPRTKTLAEKHAEQKKPDKVITPKIEERPSIDIDGNIAKFGDKTYHLGTDAGETDFHVAIDDYVTSGKTLRDRIERLAYVNKKIEALDGDGAVAIFKNEFDRAEWKRDIAKEFPSLSKEGQLDLKEALAARDDEQAAGEVFSALREELIREGELKSRMDDLFDPKQLKNEGRSTPLEVPRTKTLAEKHAEQKQSEKLDYDSMSTEELQTRTREAIKKLEAVSKALDAEADKGLADDIKKAKEELWSDRFDGTDVELKDIIAPKEWEALISDAEKDLIDANAKLERVKRMVKGEFAKTLAEAKKVPDDVFEKSPVFENFSPFERKLYFDEKHALEEAYIARRVLEGIKEDYAKSPEGRRAQLHIVKPFEAPKKTSISGVDTVRTPEELAEVKEHILRMRGKDVVVKFLDFLEGGHVGDYTKTDQERILRIATNAADPWGVGFHESLHDFFSTLGSKPEERKIKRDMLEGASSIAVMRQLRLLLKDHPEALKQIEGDKEERLAYMFQFWAGGVLKINAAAHSTEKGVIPGLLRGFVKLAKFIREIFGIVTKEEKAGAIFDALAKGKLSDPSTAGEVIKSMGLETAGDKYERILGPVHKYVNKVFSTATERVHAFGHDDLSNLVDKFHQDVGRETDNGKLPFMLRRTQEQALKLNDMFNVLRGKPKDEIKAALQNMQSMRLPTNDIERGIRKFLDNMYSYLDQAGVKRAVWVEKEEGKGYREWRDLKAEPRYFPRVWDPQKVRANEAEFIKAIVDESKGAWTEEQAKSAVSAITSSGDGFTDLAEHKDSFGFTPAMAATKARAFDFIDHTNADKFVKFQKDDMVDILTTYINHAVHRAEYARDFENDGAKIEKALKDAEKNGATPEEIKTTRDSIDAMLGTMGHDMNPKLKSLSSGLVAYENLVLLPLSLISSLPDPVGLTLRTGDVADSFKAFAYGIKRLVQQGPWKSDKIDPQEELAKTIGVIDEQNALEMMGQMYGSDFMTPKMRKINKAVFKYNGMDMWNRAMRISATGAGMRFLARHAKGSGEHSTRYLKELGVKKEYIHELPDGKIAISPEEMVAAGHNVNDAVVASQAVRNALFRFVDSTVLRPSAAQRPIWMSDPHYMIISHLKQFTYSFQQNFIRRVQHEREHGNIKPTLVLGSFVPFAIMTGLIRQGLTGIHHQNWGVSDYLADAINRSAVTGAGTFGADAWGDIERGKFPGASFLGPTINHATTVLSNDPNALRRSLPLSALTGRLVKS